MTCDKCPLLRHCYPLEVAAVDIRAQKSLCKNMWKRIRRWQREQNKEATR